MSPCLGQESTSLSQLARQGKVQWDKGLWGLRFTVLEAFLEKEYKITNTKLGRGAWKDAFKWGPETVSFMENPPPVGDMSLTLQVSCLPQLLLLSSKMLLPPPFSLPSQGPRSPKQSSSTRLNSGN